MDLRRVVFQERIGVRRLAALVYGLPPGSATLREDALTPVETLLATMIETADARSYALFRALTGQDTAEPVRLPRPGEKQQGSAPASNGRARVETDPRVIAEWFAVHS